jgi:hypothetical protein
MYEKVHCQISLDEPAGSSNTNSKAIFTLHSARLPDGALARTGLTKFGPAAANCRGSSYVVQRKRANPWPTLFPTEGASRCCE